MNVRTAQCVALTGSVRTWMAPTAASVTKATRTHRRGKVVQVSSKVLEVTAAEFKRAKTSFQQNAFNTFVFCHFLLKLCHLLVK